MEQLLPWTIFCLAVLLLCTLKPGAGRIFIGMFYLVMAVAINVVLVLIAPHQFVAMGTDSPLLGPYEWFFDHVVALAPVVFGLLTATYEVGVALLLLSKSPWVKVGAIAGIAHLLVIIPLGVWTLGNPIMGLALLTLLRREYDRSFSEILLSRIHHVGGPATRQRPGRSHG